MTALGLSGHDAGDGSITGLSPLSFQMETLPMPTRIFRGLLAGCLMAASILCAPLSPAYAQTLAVPRTPFVPNFGFEGAYDMTTPVTVSSTTYTPLTGISFTLPATTAGDYTLRTLTLCWSADVTKATSTTGSIAVFQDGVLLPTSQRYSSSAAGRNAISSCFSFPRGTPVSTTITLQAASQDTAAFTVTNAQARMTVLIGQGR